MFYFDLGLIVTQPLHMHY